ncbi:MAG: YaaL family protein [Lachnospiraceae bacterium]|nr:YaaL family protein [Lachnospiraceae bacterium]
MDLKAPILFNTKPAQVPSEQEELMKHIEEINRQMKTARQNLNLVTDECLIDSYIYELTALNKRYQYYIRRAKKEGLVAFACVDKASVQ